MPDLLLDQPNPHFVERVMALADDGNLLASDDIYTESGLKLLAKGSHLTRGLQDKLLMHKLKRPLVQSLQAGDGMTVEALVLLSRTLIEEQAILAALTTPNDVRLLADTLTHVPLDQVSLLMLTLAHRSEGAAMRHAVLVTLIALALGQRLNLPFRSMPILAAAALLHDVGELYVDPAVLAGSHQVSPDEWRSLAVHPLVGSKVIREMTGLGEPVARIVLEHHERIDGSGYPRGVHDQAISQAGQILAAAEMVVGLLSKAVDAPLRLDLALKMVSSGHAPPIMQALREALMAEPVMHGLPLYNAAGVMTALNRLTWALDAIKVALAQAEVDADNLDSRELVADADARFAVIHRAFLRSGLGSVPVGEITAALFDAPVDDLLESMGIVDELNWRLRELARFVAVRIGLLSAGQRHGLDTLMAALADPMHQAAPA